MRKTINWDKVLFWVVLSALVLSCITNEDERIQNSESIETIKQDIVWLEGNIELKEFKEEYYSHEHYYNSFPKPSSSCTRPLKITPTI